MPQVAGVERGKSGQSYSARNFDGRSGIHYSFHGLLYQRTSEVSAASAMSVIIIRVDLIIVIYF